jgi:DedD protein
MQEPEGVSTHYLLGAFFAVVLLCAVFFSLGYFLGYRQGRPSGAPLAQQVAASSDAPAPVNSSSAASAADGASAGSSPQAGSSQQAGSASDAGATPPGTSTEGVPAQSASPASDNPAPVAAKSQSDSSGAGSSGTGSDAPSGADEGELTPGPAPPGLLIQVGAVTDRHQAFTMEEALRSRGYPALVLTPQQLRVNDSYFRVIAGPYKTREAASAALRKLASDGYKPFIRQ